MGKIRISIHNEKGLNKLKGDDLSVEESLALIELAKEIIYPSYNFYEPIAHTHILMEDDADSCCQQEEPDEDVDDEPVNVPDEEIEETNTTDESTTLVSTYGGRTNVGDKISEAFAKQFGTVSADQTEDEKVLSITDSLEELNKDYHTTGIKYKIYGGEITPFYRVRWSCPKCNAQGNHYGFENIKQMYCYDCNAALTVRPANGRYPNRDEWGNFFLADQLNMKFQKY